MNALNVKPASFRRHCKWLTENTSCGPLAHFPETITRNRKIRAAITFDDGYQDNYHFAAPILEEHGLRATFFIVTGLIGTDSAPWYDQFARAEARLITTNSLSRAIEKTPLQNSATPLIEQAKRLSKEKRAETLHTLLRFAGPDEIANEYDRFMTWEQVKDLSDRGHEIGAHSFSHDLFPDLDEDELEREIVEPKAQIEAMIGKPVHGLCYPNGDYDQRCINIANRCGYQYATTMKRGLVKADTDHFELPRWFINQDKFELPFFGFSETLFQMEISGLDHQLFGKRSSS